MVSHAQGPQRKVLAGFFEEWSIYYANYNIADLQANGVAGHLSHFVYAFGNVTTNPTPSCAIADAWADFETPNLPPTGGISSQWPLFGNFAEILKLKQLNPNLKTVISLGGASSANTSAFVAAAGTPAGRTALAASCIDMFIVGNVGSDWNGNITAPGLFDGFNIDWEFPAAADKQNYTALLREFRRQLNVLSQATGKQYVLTADSPAGSQNYVNIDLPNVAKVLDFFTIDGYNYAGSWDTVTNHASPIFDSPRDPNYRQGLDIEDTISAYLKAGVPAKRSSLACLYTAPDGKACLVPTTVCIRRRPVPQRLQQATRSRPTELPPTIRCRAFPDSARHSTGAAWPFQSTTHRPRPSGPTTIPPPLD